MTQEQNILTALKAGERITPIDALNRWGCFRLGGRIHDLRKKGYDIKTNIVGEGQKKYAEYYLVENE